MKGFPAWDYTGNKFTADPWASTTSDWAKAGKDYDMKKADYDSFCADAKNPYSEQDPLAVVRDPAKGPVHYKNGNNNMLAMLAGVKKFRESLSSGDLTKFDKHIVIFFGHSTHADAPVAKLMKDNKVWTDIDLTSNLATSALATMDEIKKSSPAIAQVRYLESLSSTIAGTAPGKALIKKLFAPHGIDDMFKAGVCMVLSTDGSGVEHSNFDQEYAFAQAILEDSKTNAKAVEDKLDGNAQALTTWFLAKPSAGAALSCA